MENCISASSFRDIFNFYRNLARTNPTEYFYGCAPALPIVPVKILIFIFQQVTRIVSCENILLNINDDAVIVGDLHGHLLDLLRILNVNGFPPDKTYVFLGDIVDRGEFSTETLTLIAVMKMLFPKKVFIIRGNHEFLEITEYAGFLNELRELYDHNEVIEYQILKFFEYLPLGAIINRTNLCIHGGLGPNFTNLSDITTLKRPIETYDLDVVQEIVWGDPNENISGYMDSTRGCGYHFGKDVFKEFMNRNKLDTIIRGHECVQDGIRYSFGGKLITVFSASNYCNVITNRCGVLTLSKRFGSIGMRTYEPITYIHRSKAIFMPSQKDNAFIITPIYKTSRSYGSIAKLLEDMSDDVVEDSPISPTKVKEPSGICPIKRSREIHKNTPNNRRTVTTPRRSPRRIDKHLRHSYNC